MHNAILDIQDLFDVVTGLWPRAKVTTEELATSAWPTLLRYSATERFNALHKHKHMFPDEFRQKWRMVFELLSADATQEDRCEFQQMLDGIRRGWKQGGATQAASDYTDEQVWLSHLDWLAFAITHSSITRERKPDEEPCPVCAKRAEPCGMMRIECDARRTQHNEIDRWLAYFDETERPAPGWLGR